MCFWSTPKIDQPPVAAAAQAAATAPPPSPTATAPEPAEETASRLAERRRKLAAATKYGMTSTIKTSGVGTTGPVNLLSPVVMAAGLKQKLGQ